MKRFHYAHADEHAPATVAVIAEIGVNHDGDLARAMALIECARQAGADAVKFQYFHPDRLLSAEAELANYQAGAAASAKELLGKLTLSLQALGALRDAARRAGLGFIVTGFSVEDVAELATLELDAVKIASPDAVNPPLLDAAAGLGMPVLVSTGTCALEELDTAADVARRTGGALLQCISSYPAPDEQAALGGIQAIARRYGVTVGYSDHTASELTPALAVAAGACILEKHLTDDRAAVGPDHAASQDPAGFARCVQQVRLAAAMLGVAAKRVQPCEQDVARVSRQSVCAVRDLPAGRVLEPGDLTVKRPGVGIPAARLVEVIGQVLARPVAGDHLLRDTDLVR